MFQSRSLFLGFSALVLLTGCETGKAFSNGSAQLVAAPDSVSAMLADAADRASTALETLAAVESARAENVSMEPVDNAPPELRRAVTVSWVGPVEPMTETLADRAGYTFLTLGDVPPVPVIINVDIENKPIIDVFRDIGLQLGSRADLKVDSRNRVVEIQYVSNLGASM